MFMLKDLALGHDDAFDFFGDLQNRVITTNGWSLTQLPNLSHKHILITAEAEKHLMLYSWSC